MASTASTTPLPGDGPLLPEPLPPEPFSLFHAWFDEAARARLQPNPNAFTLATVDPDGRPSARIMLCKGVNQALGSISFFTSYTSRKSEGLAAHPWAAAVFHWDASDRQARLEGAVTRLPEAECEAYFASRAWQSRIGAWASDQSRPIESRVAMIERARSAMRRFGIDPAHPPAPNADLRIPRPPHWGGWTLMALRLELWVGGVGRVHDRAAWTRCEPGPGQGLIAGPWIATRLQP